MPNVCASEPLPQGWRIWQGPVPPELTALAVTVRNRIGQYAYGAICEQTRYQGTPVATFKCHHTWTYRGGQLIMGLCIPGVCLIVPVDATIGRVAQNAAGVVTSGQEGPFAPPVTSLAAPDPTLAIWDVQAGPVALALSLVAVFAPPLVGAAVSALAGRR